MRFGFLITARCNATCAHCSTSCGPRETAALSGEALKKMMDEGAGIWRRERVAGEDLQFGLSGGEVFLNFPLLLELVRHGTELGARVSCVSNGYWAASDEKAHAKLSALKQAGLSMLAVSTSRFHQRFIKQERVDRALRIARELGIHTALKCVLTAEDARQQGGLEDWARSRTVDKLEVFPVMPYVRDGVTLPESDYIREEVLPQGRCPAPMLTVREGGEAYTCCMPGAFVDFLSLGNAVGLGLAPVYDRFYAGARQQTLRRHGPAYFARAAIAAGEGHRLRDSYEGVCDLCAHIGSDARLSQIADQAAQRYATRRRAAARRNVALLGQDGE